MNLNLKETKKFYNREGYYIYKGLLKKNEMNEIRSSLSDYVTIKQKEGSSRNINFAAKKQINSVHNMTDWKWIKKFQKNKDLLRVVKKLISNEVKEFGAELFAKPAKIGLKAPVHQDNYYWCINDANALTVWIALEDSDIRNGGVYYYKKSHELGLLEHKKSYSPGSSQTLKYPESMKHFKKITPKLKAGDCIIHHCLVVHGSEANRSPRSRTGCTLRYISVNSKVDKFMKARYEADLRKHLKSLNK